MRPGADRTGRTKQHDREGDHGASRATVFSWEYHHVGMFMPHAVFPVTLGSRRS
jgi:hypothetical protein